MSDPSYNRNPETVDGAYAQEVYAFLASGGFVLERGFAKIKSYDSLDPYVDASGSIQIMMSVDLFNMKLGEFIPQTDSYEQDTVTITASDMINSLKKGAQVISTGVYSTLYSDFTSYVETYFGDAGGFSSLFNAASEFSIDVSNAFTGDSFIRLLNAEQQDASGRSISDLSGSITIGDIRSMLLWAIDSNSLGNRDPNVKNWGLGDGFVEGDLIWVPEGTRITLNLGIDNERYNPINNIGVENTESLTQTTTYTNGNFTSLTTSSTIYITRTVTAPLLIKLVSYSTIASLPPVGAIDISGVTPDANPADTAEIDPNMTNTNSFIPEPIVPVEMTNLIVLGSATTGTSYVTSPDATWSLNGNTTTLKSAVSSGVNYYAVGQGSSTVVKSLDGGVTWRLAFKSPYSVAGNDVLFVGNTLVTCGTGGNAVAYISNMPSGNTWTKVNTGLTAGNQLFYDVSATRIYVVGSGSNTISFASSPSDTWTGLGKYVFSDEATTIHGPAIYANTRTWVATGQGGNSLTYSENGKVYSANGTSPFTSAAAVANGADTYGTPVWVAGGQGTNTLAYSKNPSAGWTGLGAVAFTTSCKSVAYGVDASGQHVWIAAGTGTTNALAYSKNPITAPSWFGLGKTVFTTGYSVACGKDASGNALWMAAGTGPTHTLAYSRNPTVAGSWTGLGKTMFSTVGFSVAYGTDCSGNPLWIAAGQDDLGNNNALAYSRDPTNAASWTGLGSIALSVGQGVAFGTDGSSNPIWLAVGSGISTVAYSRNPTVANSWTSITTGQPSSSGYSVSYGVDASGQALWTVGQLTTNTIIYSNFPTVEGSWSTPDASMFSMLGTGFAQERVPKYIAGGVGINNMSGSLDGQTWYPIKSPFTVATHDVYWSEQQQLWVAVGEGAHTLAHSKNGIEWEGHTMTVFTIRGKKVNYSTTENKWFATGEGTYKAASSVDGHIWIPTGTTTPFPIPISTNNLVLLGTTTLGTSSAAPIGASVYTEDNSTYTINAIAYDGSMNYYAGGTGNVNLVKSTDGGANWIQADSPFTASVTDIIFAGGNTVVAAGTGTNTLAYNSGSGWAPITNGQTSVSQLFYDSSTSRVYSAGVGANTLSYAGNVASTWSGLGKYVFYNGTNTMHGPASYSNQGTVFSIGQNSGGTTTMQSSTNITTAQTAISSLSSKIVYGRGIKYGLDDSNNLVFVAVGTDMLGSRGTVISKDNGATFSYSTGSSFGDGYCVDYGSDASGNKLWVVGGNGARPYYSTNGSAWVQSTGATFGIAFCYSVAFGFDNSGNPLWLAGGEAGTTNSLIYSRDGKTWTGLGKTTFSTSCNRIAYGLDGSGNSMWVACGIAVTSSEIPLAYSYDGINWTKSTNSVFGDSTYGQRIYCVCFGKDQNGVAIWLAAGKGAANQLAYSYNGKNWTALGKAIAANSYLHHINYGIDSSGNNYWTYSTNGKYFYTYNPTTVAGSWTPISTNLLVTVITEIIQYKYPKYISGCTGAVNMKGSVDGQTWYYIKSPFTTATNDVFWSKQQQLWVAVGEGTNTVAYSSNGLKWTGLGTSVFGFYGKNVSYSASENKWYATGFNIIGGLSTATSVDGITWTIIDTTVTGAVPITANNLMIFGPSVAPLTDPTATLSMDKYVSTVNTVTTDSATSTTYAAATGAITVATSTDNGTTWNAIASPFSTAANDIVVTGDLVVATGSGGNTLAYYDGTSWTPIIVDSTSVNRLYYEATLGRTYALSSGNTQISFTNNIIGSWKKFGKYSYFGGFNAMYGPASYTSGCLWIASGTTSSGNISTSTNGTTWTTPINIGFSPKDIAYGTTSTGSSLWVATGTSSTASLAYSLNGTSWTLLNKSVITIEGNAISHGIDRVGKSKWVAVGAGSNTIAYSEDGTTWSGLSNTVFSSYGTCVAFGTGSGGRTNWVAGGSGTNCLATSVDGNAWSGVGSGTFTTTNGIKYGTDGSGNPMWIAAGIGTSHTLAYSLDSANWTGLNKTIFSDSGTCIEYGTDGSGNQLWVAGGTGTTYTLAYSSNGITWTGISNTVLATPSKLSYGIGGSGNPIWIATGSGLSSFAYSNNGITWSTISTTVFSTNSLCAFQERKPKYILCGTHLDNKPDSMRGSYDGLTWFYIKSPFTVSANDVCWSQNQQMWVAVGEGTNTLAYSSNGIKWTGFGTSVFSTRGNKITYDVSENKWYATGEGSTNIAVSSNGINWTKYPGPNIILVGTSTTSKSLSANKLQTIAPLNVSSIIWTGKTLFTTGRAIAYNGSSKYYAVGDGANTMQSSTDNGNTWTVATSPFTTSGRDIIYANTELVACGSGTNTLAYLNGTSWTPINVNMTVGKRLYYEPTIPRIYAMGQGANTMAFASNAGNTWTGLGKYVFPNGVNAMHGPATPINARLTLIGGTGANTLAYSTDVKTLSSYIGISTTTFSSSTSNIAYGLDLNRKPIWIAVGSGTGNTIAYSYTPKIANSWVGLGKSIFSTSGYAIAFGSDCCGNPLWLAGGVGTNTLAYSSNPTLLSSWTPITTSFTMYSVLSIDYGYDKSGNPLWMMGGSGGSAFSSNPTNPLSWTLTYQSAHTSVVKYGASINSEPIWALGRINDTYVYVSKDPTNTTQLWYTSGAYYSGTQMNSIEFGTDCNSNAKSLWMVANNTSNTPIAVNSIQDASVGNNQSTSYSAVTEQIFYGMDNSNKPIWLVSSRISSYNFAYNTSAIAQNATWTKLTVTPIITPVAITQEKIPKYIAGGNDIDNMKGSNDGQTWYYIPSPFTTATNDVYWSQSQQLWVAVGEGTNTIAYSSDGYSWTGLGTSIFSTRGNKVTFNTSQNMWFVAGEGTNTLAASYDGKSWMPIDTAGYVDVSGMGLLVN